MILAKRLHADCCGYVAIKQMSIGKVFIPLKTARVVLRQPEQLFGRPRNDG